MDNQLSLFGFEEPIAPLPSQKSKKSKENISPKQEAEDVDSQLETQDKHFVVQMENVPSVESSSQEDSTEDQYIKLEDEKSINQYDSHGDLNEMVAPNKPLATLESLMQKSDLEYPTYQEPEADATLAIKEKKNEEIKLPSEIKKEEESIAKSMDEVTNTISDQVFVDPTILEKEENRLVQEGISDDSANINPGEEKIVEEPFFEEVDTEVSEEVNVTAQPSSFFELASDVLESPLVESSLVGKVSSTQPDKPNSAMEKEVEENTLFNSHSYGKKGRKSFKEIDAEVDLIQVPTDEVLFSKQYYPISQVAKWFRVNNSLLRFWENEFEVLKPKKNRKGDRLFRPEDVKNLQIIYYLLRQKKYTIAGARKFIKNNKKTVDVNMKIVHTLNDFKRFLLELKANTIE